MQHRDGNGSPLDVRVLGDKASTAFSGVIFTAFGVTFTGLTAVGIVKFADEEWFEPWLSRRPGWVQHVVRFARNLSDDDDANWF